MRPKMRVGDHILTGMKAKGFISKLIKFGAWVGRYTKAARRFSHSAVVYKILADGTVILCEAVKDGAEFAQFHYAEGDYVLIEMHLTADEQAKVQSFCEKVVAANTGYGYLTFAACGINCILNHLRWVPICLTVGHTRICSGLTADALAHAGYYWQKEVQVVMPADIWLEFNPA